MENMELFYVWWLLVNGAQDYLALDFFLGISKREEKKWVWVWVSVSLFMTLLALRFQIPGMFLIHMLLLLLFSKRVLMMEWEELAAPGAVLFTLATFTEGFSALAMSLISSNLEISGQGLSLQVFVSALAFCLYAVLLRRVQGKYGHSLYRPGLSSLYLLLLPGACMVLAVRFCLRLDSRLFEIYLSGLGTGAEFTAVFVMGASVLVFFLVLESFCKVLSLREEKQAAVFLADQRKGQETYLEEIRKRNEQYASYQHDIDNHLLVLSGLLQKGEYREAEHYAEGLYRRAFSLGSAGTSGNPALDILLYEKLGHARESGLKVFCDVRIPKGFPIEDMDLCALFSNILDNAIAACGKREEQASFLSIRSRVRGKLLVIEGSNTSASSRRIREGTGLGNVRRIAGRYHGRVEWEKRDDVFRISVLLCPGR